MENFVPYELAVKLEEKGFDEVCYNYYEPLRHFLNPLKVPWTNKDCKSYGAIAAPTISQVLKWLREEKKLHVVFPFYEDKGFYYYVQRIGNAARIVSSFDDSDTCFDTAELAALAGIKYCLDNLI